MKTLILTLGAIAFGLPVFGATAFAQSSPSVPDSATKVVPIAVGTRLPTVNVTTIAGKTISLPRLLNKQPTALIFYRGGWCPYCNRQMSGLQEIDGSLRALGYQIIAVSPDRPDELRKSLEKNRLTYSLISDSSMAAAKAFGIAFRVDDTTIDRYKGFGIDLEKSSGATHHLLPVPSVFLIGRDGVVRYRSFDPDYKVRLSPDELLAAAKQFAK